MPISDCRRVGCFRNWHLTTCCSSQRSILYKGQRDVYSSKGFFSWLHRTAGFECFFMNTNIAAKPRSRALCDVFSGVSTTLQG